MFSITAPWTHKADLLILAQSILSFNIYPPQTLFHTGNHPLSLRTCSAFHLEHLSQVLLSCSSEASTAFSPLWRLCWGGKNGTEDLQHSSQSALIVLTTCTAACTHWLRAHFSLRTRTKNDTYAPSKTKGALYSAREHGMQTYEPHKTGPFCWASTTFSNTDNIIWMPSPVCHTVAWYYFVTCCSRHVSCPDLAIKWLIHNSFPMIFLPSTILARTVIMAGIDSKRKNGQNRYLNSS